MNGFPQFDLAGQTALVTGAARGLGRAISLALANAGQFEPAETCFTRVLAGAPADFNVLYNLGIAAGLAHHYERAREVLETARSQQPRNVEVLFRLAVVHDALKQTEAAIGDRSLGRVVLVRHVIRDAIAVVERRLRQVVVVIRIVSRDDPTRSECSCISP